MSTTLPQLFENAPATLQLIQPFGVHLSVPDPKIASGGRLKQSRGE